MVPRFPGVRARPLPERARPRRQTSGASRGARLAESKHQALPERASPLTRHLKLGAGVILEIHDETAAELRAHLADPRQVHDGAAVDADELPRVQSLLELAQRAIHQMATR